MLGALDRFERVAAVASEVVRPFPERYGGNTERADPRVRFGGL